MPAKNKGTLLQRICLLRRHGFYNELLWEAHDEITRLQRALMDVQLAAIHATAKQPCKGFGGGCQGMDCPKCEGSGFVLPNDRAKRAPPEKD